MYEPALTRLTHGAPLQIEDFDLTKLKVVRFTDPISTAYQKYHGKVSKRRFSNILKMRQKRVTLQIMQARSQNERS